MHIQSSIIKTLTYFDLFHYPLRAAEICFFLDQEFEPDQFAAALQSLTERKAIFQLGDFYSLRNEPALSVRRLNGNRRAEVLLEKAFGISRFLFHFPFVRGIGISGSLSKHFAGEDADIDYFIITSADRLWVARTAMHLFKKLSFLRGRQHWYCMNYYIDEKALEIQEKNIFTATELITLIPSAGTAAIANFFEANNWVNAWLPQYGNRQLHELQELPPRKLKSFLEYLLSGSLGESLDNYFHRLTAKRWKKKEIRGDRNAKGQRLVLKTDKHSCRPDPGGFQQKTILAYAGKIQETLPLSEGDDKIVTDTVKRPSVFPAILHLRQKPE